MLRAKSRPKVENKIGPTNGKNRDAARERERLFVEAMISTGGNKTESAIRAGYSAKSASQLGMKLSQRPHVIEMLRERQDALAEKHLLTTESVIAELAKIVHADPRKLFTDDGTMKPVSEWPDELAGAIASVEVFEEFQGQGENRTLVGYTKKLKLWDKNSAIEKAMKNLGLFEKDNEQKTGALAGLPPEILRAIVERLKELKGARPRLAR